MKKSAILLGSKPGSVAALLMLINNGWDIKEVVASPYQMDWVPGPSLFEISKKLGIRTIKDQEELQSDNVDLVISYMCRDFVKSNTRSRGKYPINFHAGPLPEFGGWAFYNVAILEDSQEYGCTCHIMDDSFDTGPIVKVRRFLINPIKETALSLERKTQIEMLLLFEEILSMYEMKMDLPSFEQAQHVMRYMNFKKFNILKEIPQNSTEEEIDKIARAFWFPPYDIAYIKLKSGYKLEVIPDIVKNDAAHMLHNDDLSILLNVANLSIPY